jgi:hypothetical protein
MLRIARGLVRYHHPRATSITDGSDTGGLLGGGKGDTGQVEVHLAGVVPGQCWSGATIFVASTHRACGP